jgi:hypothetical protein
MNADWLNLTANAAGLFGTIFLAAPFFRENRLKRIRFYINKINPGTGGAQQGLDMVRNRIDITWYASDYWLVLIGVVLLCISYSLNIVLWFLETTLQQR